MSGPEHPLPFVEALGEEVRRRVLEQSGVKLEWEIRRIGEKAPVLSGAGG